MQKSFPTVAIFKEAAQLPLKHVGSIFMSLLILIVGILLLSIIAGVLIGILVAVFGWDLGALANLPQRMQNQDFNGLGGILFLHLLLLVGIVMLTAHVFNFWVNLGAFGKGEAKWSLSEGRFKAAVINGFKILFILILIGLINVVVSLALSALGLAPSFTEQLANKDISDATLSNLTTTILMVLVSSAIYSSFSANLTQTALMSNEEGIEHPHTTDFAVVLILLYAIYLVPTTIVALTGSDVLTYLLGVVFGLHLMTTVPVAHGLRFRVCIAENEDTSMPDKNAD